MLTFCLDEVEGACPPGHEEACTLFERGRRYSLAEVRRAGLSPSGVAWLLIDASRRDRVAFARLRAWTEACGAEPKATVDLCMEAIRAARVRRARALTADGMSRSEAKAKVRDDDYRAMIEVFS